MISQAQDGIDVSEENCYVTDCIYDSYRDMMFDEALASIEADLEEPQTVDSGLSISELNKRKGSDIMVTFDREQAEEDLYKKMLSELHAFRESLLKLEPAEIIGNFNPYELTYKEDLLMCFEDDELCLSDSDVQFLLGMSEPLDWLYQSWCESSVSHMDILRDFIRNTVQMQDTKPLAFEDSTSLHLRKQQR